MNTPLIVTVQLDEQSQSFFDQTRKTYFPAAVNFLNAHLTLFHHLPDEDPFIENTLEKMAFSLQTMALRILPPKCIGNGVAFPIESQGLIAVHRQLQKQWISVLTPQDRQGLWPHITVQNKVAPVLARQTAQQLTEIYVPFTAFATAFVLWKYLNGPWQWYRTFAFG